MDILENIRIDQQLQRQFSNDAKQQERLEKFVIREGHVPYYAADPNFIKSCRRKLADQLGWKY